MTNRTLVYARKNIRKLRKQQGLTQEKLAEMSGIDQDYISEIERGKKNPSIKTLDSIITALKIKPHVLFLEP